MKRSKRFLATSVWQSGYCEQVTLQAAISEDNEQGRVSRTQFMQTHVETCRQCQLASAMKTIEGAVAKELGMWETFERGGDITTHPDCAATMQKMLVPMIGAMGLSVKEVAEFMEATVSQRTGGPLPDHIEQLLKQDEGERN